MCCGELSQYSSPSRKRGNRKIAALSSSPDNFDFIEKKNARPTMILVPPAGNQPALILLRTKVLIAKPQRPGGEGLAKAGDVEAARSVSVAS